jgi:predicted dithiol-disulfide oxidoreductase (DUF899 family)
LRNKIVERLREGAGPVTTPYIFTLNDRDSVPLAELFGDKQDLVVIHNMGKGCRHCTLWADGFNGVLPHLESRTAVVLMNMDPVDVQREFATSRNWQFTIARDPDGRFSEDMDFSGIDSESGKRWLMPGITTFHRDDNGVITRVANDSFGPGDPFMPIYHVLDLLQDRDAIWHPQYTYPAR